MMPRRTLWPAFLLPLALGGGIRGADAAPARPLLLLFPQATGDAGSHALVALRAKLRADGQVDVLTFDPEAPSLRRAAADAKHPEWLTNLVTADAERLEIARALGAGYVAVVGHANKSKSDIHLLETGPAARVWDYAAFSTNAAAESIERNAALPSPMLPAAPSASPPPVSQPAPVTAKGADTSPIPPASGV